MPNIDRTRLLPVRGIDENQIGEMAQAAGSNHCGAYAILAAIAAYGLPVQAIDISYTLHDNCGTAHDYSVTVNPHFDTFSEMARTLYKATGILNPEPGGEDLVQSDGYNSPAALAAVAKLFGGRVVRMLATQEGFHILARLYPQEEARCKEIVGETGVIFGTSAKPVRYENPGQNDIHLLCVNTGETLHWIARGSDGKYYDPANGSLCNDWGSPSDNFNGYTFTGLWIALS